MRISERLRTALTGTMRSSQGPYFALWLMILLALGLRLARLTFQPLWWDEGWSLYFATTDVGTMLKLTAVDIHPPFYYLLLHFWIKILGSGTVSVRLLSVLIGTLTVLLFYAAGRRLLGARGGLVAVLLLAVSPFHVYYSQEVRMYGLVTLLGLAALYWTWEVRSWRWGAWLGYVLAATAAVYTQYYAAFLLLALNLGVLIDWLRARRPVRKMMPWLSAQVAVVAFFLPWLWYAGGKLLTYIRFKVSVEKDVSLGIFSYVGRQLAAFDWGHAEGALANWWWIGLLPLAVLFLACIPLLRERFQRKGGRQSMPDRFLGVTCPLSILVVTLLCGFAVNLVFPFNPLRSERLLLLAQPAYLLLVAAALLALWRRRRWSAIVPAMIFLAATVLSLGLFYTVPRYPDDDYRPLATRVRALSLPTDAILCVHPWQVGYFTAYLPDDASRPTLVLTPREVIPRERQLWADDPARMAADLDALLAGHGRLWLPAHQAMGRVLEEPIEAYLVEHAYPVLSEWYGKNTVLSLHAASEPQPQTVTARFGGWLSLDGAALSPGPLQAGWGIVAIDLVWQLSERPAEPYTVGLRLVDKTGRVWAQRDSLPGGGLEQFSAWPVSEPHPDRHGLLVPAGTPPGDYQVTLRVYRSRDVEVLPVAFEGGSGGEVTLGTVRVVRPESPPPLEALELARPLQVDFDPLRLLGLTLYGDPVFRPGEAVEVDLFWQALAEPGEDFLPRLRLVGADGAVQAELTEKPVAGRYPTAWWRAGDLVRDPHALPIPAAAPPGRYRLVLSLVRAAGTMPVTNKQGQASVDLAEIEVVGRGHSFELPAPQHVQTVPLGSSVELIGYDLQEAVRAPGSPLDVTLHWHALQTPDRNYRVFVHLLDAGDHIVAQDDGQPGGGELPTLGWVPGEYLTDTHRLALPFDLADGVYRLEVGLYDPVTNVRLGDRVLLDELIVVAKDR